MDADQASPEQMQDVLPQIPWADAGERGLEALDFSDRETMQIFPFTWLTANAGRARLRVVVSSPRTDTGSDHQPDSDFEDTPGQLGFTPDDDNDKSDIVPWEASLIDFLNDGSNTMTRRDAIFAVTTVMRELVDNVHDHARDQLHDVPLATPLIAAVTYPRARMATDRSSADMYPADAPFDSWLRSHETPVVQFFVSDSGAGLPATIAPSYRKAYSLGAKRAVPAEDLVWYSFDPAASRHDDGPRGLGLAAVLRYTRNFQGRVAVRSSNTFAGYWHPEAVRQSFSNSRLAYSPGTFVEVVLGTRLRSRLAQERASGSNDGRAKIFTRQWTFRPDLSGLLSLAIESPDWANDASPLMALTLNAWPNARPLSTRLALELRALSRALEGRCALALVVTDAVNADVTSTFAPIDELDEAGAKRSLAWSLGEWTPPFLILSADGHAIWSGGSAAIRKLLYSIYEGEAIMLDDAHADFKRRSPEAEYVQGDRRWLTVSNGRFALRATRTDIDAAVSASFASKMLKLLRPS